MSIVLILGNIKEEKRKKRKGGIKGEIGKGRRGKKE